MQADGLSLAMHREVQQHQECYKILGIHCQINKVDDLLEWANSPFSSSFKCIKKEGKFQESLYVNEYNPENYSCC
jgi:hypothetical protein